MSETERQRAVLAALRRPDAYPERPESVQAVETHISAVYLAGRSVYKIKKPVDFGFLDFTTLEKRRYFCHREVELNRRLSPDVYFGVVSIVPTADGGYRTSRPDDPLAVEYAVHMRRLPQDAMLDERLKRGAATPGMMADLGRTLARFHRVAQTSEEIAATGDLEGVRFNVEENFAQTEPFIGRTISRETYDAIASYARAFLDKRAALFHARARDGFVRDGHGDCHTAQVCIEEDGRIHILDCIEFNERFRWADTASDVAFMAMDLEAGGHDALAQAFLDGYVDESGDVGLTEVLRFYQCYFAYVRAKVAGFRLDQPDVPEDEARQAAERARSYFDLAARYAKAPIGPQLILVGGLMGTGKTTIARALARASGYAYLSSDIVRRELVGVPRDERHFDPFGQGLYAPELTDRTYLELAERAQDLLAAGHSVIVDASFSRARDRARFRALAKQTEAAMGLVLCEAPESVVRERLEERVAAGEGPSDGRWELYARQRDAFEIPADFPARSVIYLNTDSPIDVVLAQLLARLQEPLQ